MKLNDRAIVLLKLVDKQTECDWTTGELSRFFLPHGGAYYLTFRGKSLTTYVSGAGDAAALKGLERKGLIRTPKTNLPNKYVYAITEEGRKVMESPEVRELFE